MAIQPRHRNGDDLALCAERVDASGRTECGKRIGTNWLRSEAAATCARCLSAVDRGTDDAIAAAEADRADVMEHGPFEYERRAVKKAMARLAWHSAAVWNGAPADRLAAAVVELEAAYLAVLAQVSGQLEAVDPRMIACEDCGQMFDGGDGQFVPLTCDACCNAEVSA